tara:strand:- start:234 stop:1358 length:1125 start_codon:yes stop_codon:yes gene_type:complete
MADEFEGVKLVAPEQPQKDEPQVETEGKEKVPVGVIDMGGEAPTRAMFEQGEETSETSEAASATPEAKETVYSGLVKELIDNGIIELPEGKSIESSEDLVELFDNTVNNRINNSIDQFKGSFSGAKKMFLEIEDYFDDETVAMRVAKDLDYYGKVTDDVIRQNANVQKDLLSRYLRMKGMNQNEITEALSEAEALAKLEDKALQAFPQLKQAASQFIEGKKQESAVREQETEKQNKEFFSNMLNAVDEADELVPGVSLTKRHKETMKKNMVDVVFEDPDTGQQLTELGYKQYSNPEGFERLIQFYNVLGLFQSTEKGDFKPDLSKLVKLTEKQVKKGLDQLIREQQQSSNLGEKSSEAKKLDMSFWEDAFGNNE